MQYPLKWISKLRTAFSNFTSLCKMKLGLIPVRVIFIQLRGYYTPNQKLTYTLCSISKLSTPFKKIVYASYSTLSKELYSTLSKELKIALKFTWTKWLLSYWSKYFDCLIHNLKTDRPTKMSMPYEMFLENFALRFIYCIKKKCR